MMTGCWLSFVFYCIIISVRVYGWDSQSPKEVKWFASQSCRDSKGETGNCTSLQSCFTDVRFPQLSGWSEFITGDYDSCAYITPLGVPFVGACCTKNIQIMPSATSPAMSPPIFDHIPHWPPTQPPIPGPPTHPTHPPIITHNPADLTHPPLPTFAPFPAVPGFVLPWLTKGPVRRPRPTVPAWRPRPTPSRRPRPTTSFITLPWIVPKLKTTTAASTVQPTTSTIIQSHLSKCGYVEDSFRITGGKQAGYWPWMAGLIGRRGLFCGGSLISNYHILTAAHCVKFLSPNNFVIRLGDRDLTTTSDHAHFDVNVSSITIHPGYSEASSQQDVAILRLKSKVTFNSLIRPVCLPENTARTYANESGVVIGWGATRNRGPTSKILMVLTTRLWPVSECKEKFQKVFPGKIADTNICAGDNHRDACNGDSGGPLMKYENGVYTQVGIVSWGVGCGVFNYPGVYTRVTSYLSWIKNNLN